MMGKWSEEKSGTVCQVVRRERVDGRKRRCQERKLIEFVWVSDEWRWSDCLG